MLRDTGVEDVPRERVLAFEQPELRLRDDQMKVGRFGADRAVALGHRDAARRLDLEAHPAAMTTALMESHAISPCSVRLARTTSFLGSCGANASAYEPMQFMPGSLIAAA